MLLHTPMVEQMRRQTEDIIRYYGEIDRRRLGSIVFADGEKLRQLSAILHPRIIERLEELAVSFRILAPHAVVLVDAALIYEAGLEKRFARILVAWCRPEQQLERLMAKAHVGQGEAERRIAAQMPTEEKRRRADYVIDCSGSLESTRQQVENLFPQLKRLVES